MSSKREQFLEQSIEQDSLANQVRQVSQLKAKLHDAQLLITSLTRENEIQEKRLGVFESLAAERTKPQVIKVPAGGKHQAAFALICSDWHVGEIVDPLTVSGRNEYNPTIARKRTIKLIEGALWMIESWRSGREGYGWKMDTAIVACLGDMMTGVIHDDLAESNSMSPTQEVLFAAELIRQVIDSVAKHPGIKQVIVPCCWGNHGRDTPDRRVSTAWKRSYDKRLRFHHGDAFNYRDGVGGITIPLRKWLAKLDKTEPADLTCIGHWHQYLDTGDAIVNNCLIGWSPYGQRVAPYTPASQVAFLLDAEYGKRMSTEIFV